jgi:hypothetical protein
MIQLDSPFLDTLRQEAEALGVSVEEFAKTVLQNHARLRRGHVPVADDAAFRAAMTATFDENAELYRRLAQ